MSKEFIPKNVAEGTELSRSDSSVQFQDNREFASKIRQLQGMDEEEDISGAQLMKAEPRLFNAEFPNSAALENHAMQRRENNTGLPDNLKSGMENLSGMNLDHVKVHYNSPKPAAVQAHAYAQGGDIHLASGQEKHLPHELGHVVQQAEGRVNPTTTVAGVSVNDNASLEAEATQMGDKALQQKSRK